MKPSDAIDAVMREFDSASMRHRPFNSIHEGYAVIHEELDELWEEVKKRQYSQSCLRDEAVQVAAMALRFLVDLT